MFYHRSLAFGVSIATQHIFNHFLEQDPIFAAPHSLLAASYSDDRRSVGWVYGWSIDGSNLDRRVNQRWPDGRSAFCHLRQEMESQFEARRWVSCFLHKPLIIHVGSGWFAALMTISPTLMKWISETISICLFKLSSCYLHLAQELEVYDPKYISIFLYDWPLLGGFRFMCSSFQPNQGRVMGFNRRKRSATMASGCHILPPHKWNRRASLGAVFGGIVEQRPHPPNWSKVTCLRES